MPNSDAHISHLKNLIQKAQHLGERLNQLGFLGTAEKIRQKSRQWSHRLNYKYSIRKKGVLLLTPGETQLRRKLVRSLPSFSNESPSAEILSELNANGFSLIKPSFIVPSLYEELGEFINQQRLLRGHSKSQLNSRVQSKKDYFQRLYEDSDLSDTGILVRYALQPSVVKVASQYLGQIPRLSYVEVILSHATENTDDWKISQRWHRDYDDSRMVKFFTYFTDVLDKAQGPFTYVPAPDSLNAKLNIFPIHKKDKEFERIGLDKKMQKVFGKAGSSFFVDTHRCFHRGSRMQGDAIRIAFIASFTSHATHIHYPRRISVSVRSKLDLVRSLLLP